jgi:hypothetical protein
VDALACRSSFLIAQSVIVKEQEKARPTVGRTKGGEGLDSFDFVGQWLRETRETKESEQL